MSMNQLLTTRDVSERLKLTVGRVKQLLASGELRGEKLGSQWVISTDALEQFERQRRPRKSLSQ